MGLPRWLNIKESTCQTGGACLNPGLGRSSGKENGNPLQHSCLENPMDRGAWWAAVHQVSKSRTRLTWLSSSSTKLPHSPLGEGIVVVETTGKGNKGIVNWGSNVLALELVTDPLWINFSMWYGASLVAQMLNNLSALWETWVWFLAQEDPLRGEWLPTPVFLPGEFHGQRSLVERHDWVTNTFTLTCGMR